MNNQLVSVIMSTYNEREDWLRKAIESILNQTYTNFEFLIILDNPDNRLHEKVIKEYQLKDDRIVFVKNEVNIGLVRSLNKGIGIAKGEIIARMDADEICDPNRIQVQIDYLNKNKEVALIGTNAIWIDEEDGIIRQNNSIISDFSHIKHLLKYRNFFYHPSYMFKKDAAEKIGLYREIRYVEDYDFLCRFISNGYKITNINQMLLRCRIRNNGVTLTNRNKQIKNALLVKKFYKEQLKTGNDSFDEKLSNSQECTQLDIFRFNILNNIYRVEKRILLVLEKNRNK